MLDQLYEGNQVSCTAFKEMVCEMESVLALSEKANRMRILLRLDRGFGTDENINFALCFRHGKLRCIVLKAGYPMIDRITLALAALLDDTGVEIAFAQT